MQTVPFPSNDHIYARQAPAENSESSDSNSADRPWLILRPAETPPMCFEIHFRNGQINAYPYNDFRGYQLLHHGHLIINIFGMEKTQIVIKGRNLAELASHLTSGRIRWLGETPQRGYEQPEATPTITSIETVVLA